MRAVSIAMLAAAALAASGVAPPIPVAGETRPDPFKPKTRYRRNKQSPAERLLERQRLSRSSIGSSSGEG